MTRPLAERVASLRDKCTVAIDDNYVAIAWREELRDIAAELERLAEWMREEQYNSCHGEEAVRLADQLAKRKGH